MAKKAPVRAAPSAPVTPSGTTLRHHYRALLQKPNVTACFVGKRTVDGKSIDEPTIVCCVSTKLASKSVRGNDRVPRYIHWQATSKRTSRIRTDVVEVDLTSSSRQQFAAGPGDVVNVTSPSGLKPGTVGFAIDHPNYGPIVTTAAHLFVSETFNGEITYPLNNLPKVRIFNSTGPASGFFFDGRVLRVVMHTDADYALIFPDPKVPARNLFQDNLPLAGAQPLACDALGASLFVASARGLLPTEFKGCRGTISVGASVFQGAILTDRVTIGGDSGCALLTENARICGLLVGFSGPYSVFMSPYQVLTREMATVVQGEFNEEIA